MLPSHLPDFAPQSSGSSCYFANALQTCVAPCLSPPNPPPKKRRKISLLAWFCCHFRDQLFFSLHSMPNLWKNLSQHLHFLSSPLLLNLLSSDFNDHQNTIIIFLQVSYDLLFLIVFILEFYSFSWSWLSLLLDSSHPCFLFVLVTIQFWFSSYFSNQLLSVPPPWFFASSLQMGIT